MTDKIVWVVLVILIVAASLGLCVNQTDYHKVNQEIEICIEEYAFRAFQLIYALRPEMLTVSQSELRSEPLKGAHFVS